MPSARRFPLPWTAEETDACFIVTDNTGQKLAYVYFEQKPGRRSAASLLTKDEARRIAVSFAKLQPEADLNFSVRAVDAGVIFCAPCTSPLREADFETDIGGTSHPRRTDDKLGSGK